MTGYSQQIQEPYPHLNLKFKRGYMSTHSESNTLSLHSPKPPKHFPFKDHLHLRPCPRAQFINSIFQIFSTMSKSNSSTIRFVPPKPSQSEGNENEFSSSQNQILDKSEPPKAVGSKKLETALTGTPRVLSKGKAVHSEPNSAQSTPARSTPRVSNIGAASGASTLTRPPYQYSTGGGKGGGYSSVSRGISAMNSEMIIDVPHFELDEDPAFWKDHNVQVLLRIRPLNNIEKVSQGYGRCMRQETSQTVVWLGQPETRFTFDHIACETLSQEKLFRVAGLPMVENCMSGYNSCMFAYGQTGSGKTYTMMGEIYQMDGKLTEECGITPRIFEYLFARIREEEESRKHERLEYSCKCSFLEIYNEQITDLLEPSSSNLQLREDSKKGVYVENLTEYRVRTVDDVLKLLLQGAANRKMAATHMNSESSRSHSVFTCIIESCWEKDSMTHFRFGRLNLVDLAGSERQKSSGAEGDRLKEAANINKSLSTLGSVNETLSTLKFAQRAKLIQNNAKINEDASGDVIALQQQIKQLKVCIYCNMYQCMIFRTES
ncbi:Phragmoplast orienting kinesin-1 [Forsythia ovata]|uniref:Kinesin-like protein n=1 Tax=Forsythia ovata TaxID=205694 RepID=A0ABD1PKT4_9LAMI